MLIPYHLFMLSQKNHHYADPGQFIYADPGPSSLHVDPGSFIHVEDDKRTLMLLVLVTVWLLVDLRTSWFRQFIIQMIFIIEFYNVSEFISHSPIKVLYSSQKPPKHWMKKSMFSELRLLLDSFKGLKNNLAASNPLGQRLSVKICVSAVCDHSTEDLLLSCSRLSWMLCLEYSVCMCGGGSQKNDMGWIMHC